MMMLIIKLHLSRPRNVIFFSFRLLRTLWCTVTVRSKPTLTEIPSVPWVRLCQSANSVSQLLALNSFLKKPDYSIKFLQRRQIESVKRPFLSKYSAFSVRAPTTSFMCTLQLAAIWRRNERTQYLLRSTRGTSTCISEQVASPSFVRNWNSVLLAETKLQFLGNFQWPSAQQ